ncbi:MAG: hypothetical protein IPM92_08725 [Saprospiraceae bacterium]|nr:hypothetical protein [Saprospiraceae bacterium]
MKMKLLHLANLIAILCSVIPVTAESVNPVATHKMSLIAPPYYGELSVSVGTASQTLTTQNVWYKLTGFTTNGESSETTPDHINDKITVTNGDYYQVSLSGNIVVTKSEVFKLAIYVDGVALPEATQQFLDKDNDNENALSIKAIAYIGAGKAVEVYATCTSKMVRM